MRFQPYESGLELVVEGQDIQEIVLALFALFIPRHADFLWFLPDTATPYPRLEALSNNREGFTLIPSHQDIFSIVDRINIVQRGTTLVLPLDGSRFTEEEKEEVRSCIRNL